LLQVRTDNSIDVVLLTETWHDKNSACFGRLRSEGFQVVDRPRPRLRDDVLSTNHGGIAVVAVSGVRLLQLDLGITPTTFEHVCVRMTTATSSSSCVVLLVYRPGSEAVTPAFFDEFADALDRVATFVDPVYVAGDLNVRLDRFDDVQCVSSKSLPITVSPAE